MNKTYLFRALLIVLASMLLMGAITAYIWLRLNTNFLGPTPSPEQVAENNENFSNLGEDLLEGFSSQVLNVPGLYKQDVFAQERTLNLPPQFRISVFASGMNTPRFFTFDTTGNLYVAEMGAGRIVMIPDTDADGVGDNVTPVISGLQRPSSVFFYKDQLYIAEENQVSVLHGLDAGTYTTRTILIPNLPTGGHSTRTVVVGPDDKLYVSIGSSCNICEEGDIRRAAVVQYELDGTQIQVFASGLRNSVGLVFHANSLGENELWSVDNGRDNLGDNLPVEEVNILEEGRHYGWPYCHGNKVPNPEYAGLTEYCQTVTEAPAYEMQAHSAPLGLTFAPDLTGGNFPRELRNNLFVAFHGSWNRSIPTGYKVVRINTAQAGAQTVDFITGFLDETGQVWGRPVGVGFDSKGIMYVSDDKAGAIYRITYTP